MSAKKSQQKRNTEMEAASMSEDSLVISYMTLRQVVGILGMALPFVVFLGGKFIFKTDIQSSISSYYYTGMRDVFVGILWTIGFFLFSYRGYGPIDNITGNLACVFAVVVSLFPTTADGVNTALAEVIGGVHLFFAALFFLTLSYFSLVLFPKTNLNKQFTLEKAQRNNVYKVCGYVMLACIVSIAIYSFVLKSRMPALQAYEPVFWFEAFAIFAFGVSWFTKGEAILADKK
jgi:hypothetical protein